MTIDNVKARHALKQINDNARQVMENMNDIVWAMHTGNGESISFENKLKNYSYELLTPLNIACTYQINKNAEKQMTGIETRKNILLITKEAINNIAKHSGATTASIHLILDGKTLVLEIIDDGKGLEKRKNGNGLQNMQDRVQSLGGNFELISRNGGGTHIRCRVPIAKIRD
jgi:signal transduction histidine kinase